VAQLLFILLVCEPICAASMQAVGQRQKELLLARLVAADKQLAAALQTVDQLPINLLAVVCCILAGCWAAPERVAA
jgi:hypothetical protein